MANLQDIKKRIRSIKNTQQITRAMKMVAAAKLRRAQESILATRPYAYKVYSVLANLADKLPRDAHKLLEARPVECLGLVVMASDRGLCGSFNGNILRYAERYYHDALKRYGQVKLIVIGGRGVEYFERRNIKAHRTYAKILDKVDYQEAAEIGKALVDDFVKGEYDALDLVYNEFKSAMLQRVTNERLLPVNPDLEDGDETPSLPEVVAQELQDKKQEDVSIDYLYEPNQAAILEALLPRHLQLQIYRSMLESSASEHGARMSAMDSATKNASELIDGLTLQYNRARQAAITTELMEIVGGKEALEQSA